MSHRMDEPAQASLPEGTKAELPLTVYAVCLACGQWSYVRTAGFGKWRCARCLERLEPIAEEAS